jgi:hypothetical protein
MADASTQCYFLDGARNQQGPVSMADIARLIHNGTINRDTLIWYPGMADWRPAGQVNEFASLFGAAPPPTRPPQGAPPLRAPAYGQTAPMAGAQPASAGASDALVPDFPVWGLFWRSLVFGYCAIFIIPAPWCLAALYGYKIRRTSLPDGRRLTFSGHGGDIWYLIIGPPIALIIVALLARVSPLFGLLDLPLIFVGILVPYLVVRWVCAKVGAEDGSVKLTFAGGMWGLFGWQVLLGLSFITIIGWAWVLAALMRWLCRNVSGSHRFEFAGTGLEILWRLIVYLLASMFVIPIPWMLRWYYVWFVSQIRVADHLAAFD